MTFEITIWQLILAILAGGLLGLVAGVIVSAACTMARSADDAYRD